MLESFPFVLFQRTWRKKLFAKTRERKLNFVFVLVLFFSFDYITGKSLIRQRRTRVIIYVECIRIRIQFTQIKLKSNLLFGVRPVFFFFCICLLSILHIIELECDPFVVRYMLLFSSTRNTFSWTFRYNIWVVFFHTAAHSAMFS